jgi:anti-sigma regulatory factor (Ser/Thr protein kinase)
MDESESEDSLSITVVSETGRVPALLERVDQFARRHGAWDTNGLLLVVRELVMNAIVHGNDSEMARMARIRLAWRDGLFEVQVDDEGEGFDYDSLVLGLPEDPQSLTKRGLVLVHELSEDLAFERGGSRVRAIVDPGSQSSAPDRGHYDFMGRKSDREDSCTSPMAKSL